MMLQKKIDDLINNKGKNSVDFYHKKLGKIMWDKCGMSRNTKGYINTYRNILQYRCGIVIASKTSSKTTTKKKYYSRDPNFESLLYLSKKNTRFKRNGFW